MRTLCLNTYAGSLLLGARSHGADIIGTYEDVGFGSDIQAANFPDVPRLERYDDWPKQDLHDVCVLAHPPCSAFSVQNTSPSARGTDSKAFSCTKKVLDYAMRNGAAAIAVESVMGALQGAWHVHDEYAKKHGYHLYRVLQVGAMFRPQWRERFWAIFIKKDVARERLSLTLKPSWMTVREAVDGHEDGPAPGNLDKLLTELRERFINEVGCTPIDMDYFFNEQDPPHRTIGIMRLFQERMFPEDDLWTVSRDYIGTFSSGAMCYLNPNGLSPTILGSTWLYYRGRNLSETGYKLLMGFPSDYVFPGGTRRQMRMFLSKGVIPQVAAWVYSQIESHLNGWPDGLAPGYHIEIDPGQLADFRIRKSDWGQKQPRLKMEDVT